MMKVSNMTSSRGNKIANQFIVRTGLNTKISGRVKRGCTYFQSYQSIIAMQCQDNSTGAYQTYLDEHYWDYSVTTGKYRNQFLGENKAETQKKIDTGEYKLVDLNK